MGCERLREGRRHEQPRRRSRRLRGSAGEPQRPGLGRSRRRAAGGILPEQAGGLAAALEDHGRHHARHEGGAAGRRPAGPRGAREHAEGRLQRQRQRLWRQGRERLWGQERRQEGPRSGRGQGLCRGHPQDSHGGGGPRLLPPVRRGEERGDVGRPQARAVQKLLPRDVRGPLHGPGNPVGAWLGVGRAGPAALPSLGLRRPAGQPLPDRAGCSRCGRA
mmetsp:Transcript_82610/g.242423  ORF Transcript_82610/g.242423 Transcript_82610/m.242423 type:complete len:219 (+) Transcript_82610:309-965(+)